MKAFPIAAKDSTTLRIQDARTRGLVQQYTGWDDANREGGLIGAALGRVPWMEPYETIAKTHGVPDELAYVAEWVFDRLPTERARTPADFAVDFWNSLQVGCDYRGVAEKMVSRLIGAMGYENDDNMASLGRELWDWGFGGGEGLGDGVTESLEGALESVLGHPVVVGAATLPAVLGVLWKSLGQPVAWVDTVAQIILAEIRG